uniref:DUF3105 domain-containing protein n=1 Tax=Photinus pyralis TaxID=7054 RepID=A0A1Y1LUY2_PHOPY
MIHGAVLFVLTLCINSKDGLGLKSPILGVPFSEPNEKWNGKWFPYSPMDDGNNVIPSNIEMTQKHIQMGVISDDCDNGKDNITVDWNDSPINYTCFDKKSLYLPNIDVQPIEVAYNIPKEYAAMHECMNTTITYNYPIPTFGPHRPLWPKYGEYLFVPVQRWLHNLEHGAIVMLYHPCANVRETEYLKEIVKNCLYRHIITPYTLLTMDRPLALLAWGHSLEMSKVDTATVINFIRRRALQGPERISRDGDYDHKLVNPAKVVSDQEDSDLCIGIRSKEWF